MSEREDLQQVLDKLGWDYKVPEKKSLVPMGGLIISKERKLLERVLDYENNGILDFCGMHTLKNDITELLAQPEQEPLSDYILSKEIDIIKKDNDFSNVRPWQIYYLARRIEELHGIGGEK